MKTSAHFFRITFVFILLSTAWITRSQDTFYTINGILKDAESGEVISFASITIPETGIATVSNSDGEFMLKVSITLGAEYFEISHLGYRTARFEIIDGIGKELTYYLNVQRVQLSEVIILTGDGRELVESAFRKINQNYGEVSVMMSGFYRESIMQNRAYVSISEAVVDIYKAPYSSPQSDQVKIFKGRKGSNVKKADTLVVELQGGPSVMMLLDIVKNPELSIAFDNLDNYHFDVTSVAKIDGDLNWVIDFSPAVVSESPFYFGKLYISQESQAITRCEFSLDLGDEFKASSAFVRKKPIGLMFKPVSTSYLVNFKESGGKYYLNYARVELKFRCDWNRKIFKKNYTLTSELAITDRKGKGVERFSRQEVFKSNMIFTSEVDDFKDENFWGANNIIEPEKSIEHAIDKLTRKLE